MFRQRRLLPPNCLTPKATATGACRRCSEWDGGGSFFRDGRKDSLWSQVTGPLTNPDEHALTAEDVASYVQKSHAALYHKAFGRFSKNSLRVLADVGKAIAAFETTIVPPRTPLDDYVDGLRAGKPTPVITGFSPCAERGLRTFASRGRCI